MPRPPKPVSGHIFKIERKRGPQWYAKLRQPDGRVRAGQTIFLAAAFTGLRLGELLALRWRDVDFVYSAIHVRQSFTTKALLRPKQ